MRACRADRAESLRDTGAMPFRLSTLARFGPPDEWHLDVA